MMPIRACLAASLAFAASAPGAIIYSSFLPDQQITGIITCADGDETNSRIELPGGASREFDAQIGDALVLQGSNRFVTSFAVRIAAFPLATGVVNADVELNIYSSVAGLPGTLLWTGMSPGVTIASDLYHTDVTFAPNITVPDKLVFGIAYSNITNPGHRALGIAGSSFIFVGGSSSVTLAQDTETLAWRTQDFGSNLGQLQARIIAVPAPAPALAFGAALLCPRRRGTSRFESLGV